MLWALYGLIHSAMRAAFAETGRVLRIDPWKMALWQSLTGFAVLVPFAAFLSWPSDPRFYLAAVGTALILTVGTLIQMTLSAQRTGRVSGIYMPIEALAGFVIWLFVAPEASAGWLMFILAAAAFAVSASALLKIRPHDIGRDTSLIILPAALTYAVAGVVTKLIILPVGVSVLGQALVYATVSFAIMALVMGMIVALKGKTDNLMDRRLRKAGSITGAFSAISYVCFIAAVVHAPNPGFVSMLAMLLPVWLLGWHRWRKIEDAADPKAAAAIIAGVVLAILASLF